MWVKSFLWDERHLLMYSMYTKASTVPDELNWANISSSLMMPFLFLSHHLYCISHVNLGLGRKVVTFFPIPVSHTPIWSRLKRSFQKCGKTHSIGNGASSFNVCCYFLELHSEVNKPAIYWTYVYEMVICWTYHDSLCTDGLDIQGTQEKEGLPRPD